MRAFAAAFAVLAAVAPAAAQEEVPWDGDLASLEADAPPRFASELLQADHWAVEAARRLTIVDPAAGRPVWAGGTATAREVALVFLRGSTSPAAAVADLARGYLARLREEQPGLVEAAEGRTEPGIGLFGGSLGAGWERREGELSTGRGVGDEVVPWDPPRPIEDRSDLFLSQSTSVHLHRRLAASGRLDLGRDGSDRGSDPFQVVAQASALGAWVGRRAPAFGPGPSGVVLGGGVPLFGGGLFLIEPVGLPGPLRRLGPFRFELFVADAARNGGTDPLLWGGRGAFSPHPRLELGVNRAAMMRVDDFNVTDFLFMVLGKHAGEYSEFENQVVSVEARYRPPVPSLPLELYVEWGFDDSAGAWKDVPGVVAGALLAAVPGLPSLSLGLERTSFAGFCCGNPMWYRHLHFQGGWAEEGRPLGHALGGHGREWLARAGLDAMDARLRLDARAFLRDRGEENLFAPNREGRSTGAALRVRYGVGSGFEIDGAALLEEGESGWRRSRLEVGARRWLP